MIGSLGRHGDEGLADDDLTKSDGQFIKFYQRLGNVGVWGFGDGAFQFNFPDHTKIVLDATGTWCHFWHLPQDAATRRCNRVL